MASAKTLRWELVCSGQAMWLEPSEWGEEGRGGWREGHSVRVRACVWWGADNPGLEDHQRSFAFVRAKWRTVVRLCCVCSWVFVNAWNLKSQFIDFQGQVQHLSDFTQSHTCRCSLNTSKYLWWELGKEEELMEAQELMEGRGKGKTSQLRVSIVAREREVKPTGRSLSG